MTLDRLVVKFYVLWCCSRYVSRPLPDLQLLESLCRKDIYHYAELHPSWACHFQALREQLVQQVGFLVSLPGTLTASMGAAGVCKPSALECYCREGIVCFWETILCGIVKRRFLKIIKVAFSNGFRMV